MSEGYITYYYRCETCGENMETTNPREAKARICPVCNEKMMIEEEQVRADFEAVKVGGEEYAESI